MAANLPLILALDVSGQPHRWINYEAAAYYYSKEAVAWSLGEHDYTIYGGTQRISGLRSSLTMNTIVALRGVVKSKHLHGMVPTLSNKELFRRDLHVCAYCGNEFTAAWLTRDHVTPVSKNGTDTWNNVVTSCGGCNRRKADRSPEEANMQLLYVPYTPNRAEYLILKNRSILADQMDYLMKSVPSHSRLHGLS